MKVLLWTRPDDKYYGGDLIQAKKTALALKSKGIEADIKDNSYLSDEVISEYDIIHIFTFHMRFNPERILRVKELGKKCVCSMIYFV